MSLDSEQGCQLLRVLIQLAMSSHTSLSAKSLKLLIRHFSQRKEIVNGFKQVGTIEEVPTEEYDNTTYLIIMLPPETIMLDAMYVHK